MFSSRQSQSCAFFAVLLSPIRCVWVWHSLRTLTRVQPIEQNVLLWQIFWRGGRTFIRIAGALFILIKVVLCVGNTGMEYSIILVAYWFDWLVNVALITEGRDCFVCPPACHCCKMTRGIQRGKVWKTEVRKRVILSVLFRWDEGGNEREFFRVLFTHTRCLSNFLWEFAASVRTEKEDVIWPRRRSFWSGKKSYCHNFGLRTRARAMLYQYALIQSYRYWGAVFVFFCSANYIRIFEKQIHSGQPTWWHLLLKGGILREKCCQLIAGRSWNCWQLGLKITGLLRNANKSIVVCSGV